MKDETIMDEPIFIIGSPRSGTTWVQRLLMSVDGVAGYQESHFFCYFGDAIKKFKKQEGLKRVVGLPAYMNYGDFKKHLRNIWYDMMSPYIEKSRADTGDVKLLVEKTPGHALHMVEILEIFPKAKFIHVLRDSRAVSASLIAASNDDWGISGKSSAIDAAYHWCKHVELILNTTEMLQLSSDKIRTVRYEDISRNTEKEFRRLLEFTGLQVTDEKIEEILNTNLFKNQVKNNGTFFKEPKGFFRNGDPDSWRKELSKKQKEDIYRITSRIMNKVGYECTK